MKNITVGILAHVDAGKTTLSEAMLYTAGKIKKLGRVDWRNTYLDTHELERERGITIFSKQAVFDYGDMHITLLDTPGHVDFSAETERVLSVLDYVILVISGTDGAQSHTETLWYLLEKYRLPVFVFVTKMDLKNSNRTEVLDDIRLHLSKDCIDFADRDAYIEHAAMCDEEILEKYSSGEDISYNEISHLIDDRKIFPCFFGSGLKLDGVAELLDALDINTKEKTYPEEFSAKVYKIGYDTNDNRLTYLKLTGGKLANRDTVNYYSSEGEEFSEKITSVRIYSGTKYETPDTVYGGQICAVAGLSHTYAGQCIGNTGYSEHPLLEPVMNYRLKFPPEIDAVTMLPKLRKLEEEDPMLRVGWNERYGDLYIQVMGAVQSEVITAVIESRFGVKAEMTDSRILYRETITSSSEGVGHFEPLRHYAEVHLLLEPLPAGSGLVFGTICSEDTLERNWQRLVLTHLEEKKHIGVLTGSPITDMKITLVAGQAHLKHTMGGDFREATYRAVRQGLMRAKEQGKCVLLEPYYYFRAEVPSDCIGRTMADIINCSGSVEGQESLEDITVITGKVPVSEFCDYAAELASYTHGKGRLTCRNAGYYPCHNQQEIIDTYSYNPEADLYNSPDSVFCSHGAGISIPWYEVEQHMHLEGLKGSGDSEKDKIARSYIHRTVKIDEKELEAIMEREFGPIRRPGYGRAAEKKIVTVKKKSASKSLYIIDGYNLIFAWDELAAIAENDLELSRQTLLDILANYQSFTGRELIVVFDAYNVKGASERKFDYHGLHVVYTKEGELGDTYIERLTSEIGNDRKNDLAIRVITSDGLIQLQAVRSGVFRYSAREFKNEVMAATEEIRNIIEELNSK